MGWLVYNQSCLSGFGLAFLIFKLLSWNKPLGPYVVSPLSPSPSPLDFIIIIIIIIIM